MTIVEKIHTEIDTAEARLLQEAKNIIALNSDVDDKAERLEKIGFLNAAPVVKNKLSKAVLVHNSEEAKRIEYYKHNYPFLKFITENELDRICEKYGLIYMPIENYVGDVPLKNITDIENAQPRKDNDIPEDKIWSELKRDNSFFLTSASGGNWCGMWGTEWYKIPKRIDGKHFFGTSSASEYLRDNLGFKAQYLIGSVDNITEDRKGLFICAPKNYFKGNSKAISFTRVEDPIVFRYVKGGIQVITKWGLEASDETLLNEINN